ncbi:MAG: insulinase family protein [Planctomycetia bacterium]|nr:insulinase family protein [Planctomycetia bacterium]
MPFHESRLANGLEVIAESNPDAAATAVGFFVRTGARDETDPVAGVSHFLEHMIFKGTPSRSADDVNREFDEMGAQYNAQTSEETTIYYASVLPEQQDAVVSPWADVLRPSLREEDFNTEKKVIIEEIRMYDDQPPFGADEQCRALFFGPHPLGRSVLGTIQSITDLKVDDMRQYFETRYAPENITLVAAGQVDFPALVASAQQACGGWKPAEATRKLQPVKAQNGFVTRSKSQATQEYVLQMAVGPAANDPRRHAAKLLATVLGDDTGSRLYWELVHTGLAEFASVSHYEYEGAGAFLSYLSCEPDEAEQNMQRMLNVIRTAEAGGISQSELDQARSKLVSRVVLGSERSRHRMFAIGANWMYRDEYRTVREHIKAFKAVTVAALAELLAEFPLSRNSSIAIGPLTELRPPK